MPDIVNGGSGVVVNIINGVEFPAVVAETRKFSYDFAVDGGAVGNITLRGGTLPPGAILVGYCTKQPTAFTSGGAATITVTCESSGDLQPTQLYSNITFATVLAAYAIAGNGVLALGAGTYGAPAIIETTAARSVVMAVAGAALTAGKFDVFITFLKP